jgi:hypothetical protein
MTEHFDEKLSYEELWGAEHLPSYDHWFASLGPPETDNQFKKHILLLRDYNTLASTSDSAEFGFNMVRRMPSGLQIDGYIKQICKFERLKSSKMVVYFEDLVSDNSVFITVANFLDIKYDLKKIDFENLRDYARRMYVSSGHLPSPKIDRTLQSRQELTNTFRRVPACTDSLPHVPFPFEKYLARYDH